MMSEPLPCPFCGSAADTGTRMDEDLSTHAVVEWRDVGCNNCGISFSMPDGYDETAMELWNRRAEKTKDSDDE